jgi:hypothetical protein
MIHIVFNEPDVKVLSEAQALDETLAGEIILIRDDFAVGPLADLQTPEGWQARRDFWRELLQASGDYDVDTTLDMVNDKMTLHQLLQKMEEHPEEVLWVWAAQNQHDVSGYYWLISHLQPLQGRVFILYLNNLPFISDKGNIFYPKWLSEIPAKEFLKAKKLARPVTPAEFEVDIDEWKKVCSENKMVRRLEGGKKLAQFDADYFDAALAKYVYGDFSKASKIISNFLSKEKETTGDVYLIWRLKSLAEANSWEVRGDMQKGTSSFDLRNPAMPQLRKKAEAETEEQP